MPLQQRQSRLLVTGLYLNAALLVVVLVVLLGRGGMPTVLSTAMAQNQLPIGGGAGVFIVPGQFSTNTYGCYIMDVDAQTICAYQYYPADKQLRLVAARSYRYDRRLQNFNTGNPSPEEVRKLLELEQAGARTGEQNPPKNSPEAPPKE